MKDLILEEKEKQAADTTTDEAMEVEEDDKKKNISDEIISDSIELYIFIQYCMLS